MRPLPSDPRYLISEGGTVYGLRGNPLSPWIKSGYQAVKVSGSHRYVHDLVAETYIGTKPEGGCVRHGNLGPLNNSVTNICYGSYSDNEYDKVHAGTHQQASKTECPSGHKYDEANTIHYTARGYNERLCRTCQRQHSRNFKAKKRLAA